MAGLDEAALHEAALRHLARFAATEAGLRRVLGNRIRRWARAALAEGRDAEWVTAEAAAAEARAAAVATRLAAAGAVDDAGFALARARRLMGGGRSGRAARAHLAAKGVPAELAEAALADSEVPDELTAALRACRRRRIGPFARAIPDSALRRKWLGVLARAGFPGAIARQALDMPPEEAEARAGPRGAT